MKRSVPLPAALLVTLLVVTAALVRDRLPASARLRLMPAASPPAPTRVLIVLDTVRADYTSLCGFDHPTTPTLEALAARPGAQLSCRAYAPGSWTLPSHASFFTGLPVSEHGAHYVPSERADQPGGRARGLDGGAPTLAERFVDLGYQTASVSGNPYLEPRTGLVRGFEQARYRRLFGDLEGETLVEALREALLEVDPERPLFLFLNISDAHAPWDAVPEGHPWLAARPGMEKDLEGWWADAPGFKAGYQEALVPLYTWGEERADDTLARSLEVLEAAGWLGEGSRVVITSDHGEALGEHDLLDHGRNLYEPNNLVFLLALGEDLPALPSPVNAMEAYSLTLDGTLAGYPVESVAYPDHYFAQISRGAFGVYPWAARWAGREKWLLRGDDAARYDLSADPGEQSPLPTEVDLSALLETSREFSRIDPEMLELLRATGYTE
jgi:hypothetical protein